MSGICGSNCPELDNPPSKTNMGVLQIIELVIMGVVGILCLIGLVDFIKALNKSSGSWDVITILRLIEYVLIVAGLCLIIIGLFCSISQYQIRTGIMCFAVGGILSIVITVLYITNSRTDENNFFYNICYIILMIFLVWVLWRQSGHL